MTAPERVRWTVEQLAVRPTQHLLEVGCGPGHAVSLVCARLTRGTVTAIDRSATQVARARDRAGHCVTAGRARIEQGALEDFDPGRRRFDTIYAVNVNVFWTAPARSVAHLRRLLGRGGTAYLAYEPPTEARLRDLRDRLPQLLGEHGFAVADVRTAVFRAGHGLCIIGRP